MRRAAPLSIGLLLLSASLAAQGPATGSAYRFAAAPLPFEREIPQAFQELGVPRTGASVIGLAWAGTLGTAAGILGGAAGGWLIENLVFPCTCDDPGLAGVLVGGFAGPVLLTPYVVHHTNDRRGSLPAVYIASALVAGTGVVLLPTARRETLGWILLGTPVAQVLSAVAAERWTEPR